MGLHHYDIIIHHYDVRELVIGHCGPCRYNCTRDLAVQSCVCYCTSRLRLSVARLSCLGDVGERPNERVITFGIG